MELNRCAQIMGKELKAIGVNVKHKDLLDMVAKSHGHKNWKFATREKKEFIVQVDFEYRVRVPLTVEAYDAKDALQKAHEVNNNGYMQGNFKLENDDMEDMRFDDDTPDGDEYVVEVGYEVEDEDGERHSFKQGDEDPEEENAGNMIRTVKNVDGSFVFAGNV